MRNLQPYQLSYYNILLDLLDNFDKKVKTRVGVARSRFAERMDIDLKKEFPLMDIKHVSFKSVLVELLWFLKGDTNIKYLVDNNCNIWNDDAFRWYNEKYVPMGAPKIEKDLFLEWVKLGRTHKFVESIPVAVEANFGFNYDELKHEYTYGDLDIIYGYQWRSFGGKVDQIKDAIEKLKKDPDDRRMIVLGHNPADIADGNVGLPACHNYMQFYTQPIPLNKRADYALEQELLGNDPELKSLIDTYVHYKFGKRRMEVTHEVLAEINAKLDALHVPSRYISTYLLIRSNDFFLGNPYNIASYAILTRIIGQLTNMLPNQLTCEMVDCHLYEEHVIAANEWIKAFEDRLDKAEAESKFVNEATLCKAGLGLKQIKDIDSLSIDDFVVVEYKADTKINAPLLT